MWVEQGCSTKIILVLVLVIARFGFGFGYPLVLVLVIKQVFTVVKNLLITFWRVSEDGVGS